MQRICEQCGAEFDGLGKYCSGSCRAKASRARAKRTDEPAHAHDSAAHAQAHAPDIPNYGRADCECMHCQQCRANGSRLAVWHGRPMTASEILKHYSKTGEAVVNRQALPGDVDYRRAG